MHRHRIASKTPRDKSLVRKGSMRRTLFDYALRNRASFPERMPRKALMRCFALQLAVGGT